LTEKDTTFEKSINDLKESLNAHQQNVQSELDKRENIINAVKQ
jgi:hypothetical protein